MMTEALMHALQAAALWSGLLILMLLVLSGMVVSGRRRHMVSFGDGGHSDLLAASRAFGNCVEYATPGMAAMALLALVSGQAWMVHAVGATLLAGRILHALGLMLQTGPSIGRVLGMALTWIALLSAGVGLIAYGVL
ncbi:MULTISPECIES: MAPEG family protein [Brevundimonas]|uniref:MAPEG family protein n=1 Tax=Brevundimonas albigilva TaxID=1312364 RepID=A0ABY4SJE4_9CAUL|nr:MULTISPECIES: MAPEG family protein [Brevundimonas]URI14353.1 MAPEG family protein [Brevundimonas albigilva]